MKRKSDILTIKSPPCKTVSSIEHRKENKGDKNKMEDTRTVFSI